ncbi:kinesin-like protein KIN-12C isoform X1 [Lactuca sativa]|uniref:kinesin-like protein KIN-12C isoform X1 n=1 Tax=Lactuca sativa TaxID=4236 RepID=UPI000CD7FCBE|nr:kinesin-like protein KIN-12C isoform X1 [Lactuca sativa]
MVKDSSKSSQAEGNENQFDKTLSNSNPLDIPFSRTPLNAIPDPSQFSKEFLQEVMIHNGFKDKSLEAGSTSNRRKFDSAHSTPARSVSRTTYVGQLGACTGPRALQSTGERGANSTRVSRRISNVNCEPPPTEVPHFELVEDPSFWNDHNVQVLIRMRPLSNMEKMGQGYVRCLKQESLQTLAWLGQPEVRFTFDHIVSETISQEKLFRVAGLPMVDNCMSGYNSCMFAYGQTGSGKTYTMMGEISQEDGKLVDDCGITPRLFEYLFTRIKLEEENRRDERLKYSCKCSFLEIYNEQITDLLEPSSTNLQVREDLKEGVYVENLTEYNVKNVDEVLKLLLQGAANRKVAGTDMNSESSRSHSVFTCIVESRWEKDSVTHLRFGRLNLVDLAGSERQRSSAAGERVKEASYINKSLSTLGLVIMSLVDVAHGKHRHVPYRDSRLTFLLQDSLGGNSKTTIIANVSPSMCAANETLSTLKFAQRAKLIQNNAKVNEDASGDVTALQRQIQMLKEQMSLLVKHQKISKPVFHVGVGPTFQPSLGDESFERQEEACGCGEDVCDNFPAFRTLHSQTKPINGLALPKADVQSTKMLLRFREEKIKRLELLANGIISTDHYLMDENMALMEEIHQLQARIDKNSQVTRFQDCYEHGERGALLAEVLALHDQLLKTLEVEESYVEQNFPTERENELMQDDKSSMGLEEYKCANSKLIRKVDELKTELSKYISYNQTAAYPVGSLLSSIGLGDEMEACDEFVKGVVPGSNCLKRDNMLQSTDNIQELMEAKALLGAMKSEQATLVAELQYIRQENDRLVETLNNTNNAQTHECHTSENQNLPPVTNNSMMDLQARLDKMAKDLDDVDLPDDLEDRLSHSSLKNEVCLVDEEVENEATNAILNLQEELASLQVKYHGRLCSMSEENKKLRRIIEAKEDEVYTLHTEWERASLELTSFLLDGSKSLKDASGQIEAIACSFPHYNVSVTEHVKKAAIVCIEKQETILRLEKNLVDAQTTILEMQEKLNSLRTATIALTEIQSTQHDERTKIENQVEDFMEGICEMRKNLLELKETNKMVEGMGCTHQMQENQLLMVQRIITELVSINNKLDNMKAYFEDLDDFSTDISTSSSNLSDDEDLQENIEHSSNQESEKQDRKTHLFLKKQFMMAYEAFIKLDVQLASVFKDKEYVHNSMKIDEKKTSKADCFFSKFEEARATMTEADNMLNVLMKANEEAKVLAGRWKQAAEDVMVDKASLVEELANSVSVLEGSFHHLKKEAENSCHLMYSDALAMFHGVRHDINESRSSLQDIYAERMENSFASFVVQQCQIGEYNKKFKLGSRLHEELIKHVETLRFRQNPSTINDSEEEVIYSALAASKESEDVGECDLIGENLKLNKELERKNTLLNGLLFDFSLLQESASTRKDIKDEAEKLFTDLRQVQHELKMKTTQLDDMLIRYEKLESCLSDTESALSASKSCLQHAEETVNALSYQNGELRSLLEDLYHKKSETEEKLEEQKEIVKSLEKEIDCGASSVQEHFLFSLEGITDDLKRVSNERDQLCEQVNSLQEKLEMAYTIADENEAIAVEARQVSEANKIYAEQKDEEIKILENSVEELDSTINVLEKRVNDMEEELQRQHKIRDSLEVELQSLSQRLLTVESFRDCMDSDNSNLDQYEYQISRKLQARIKDLEDERAEQANEIKQCKEYISELVIHAEAQALQYQQKYKSLEAMVSLMKTGPSKSSLEAQLLEKSMVRGGRGSSPFRCIGNLVQQMNTEKDQELSLAKARLHELESVASSRQKEICMLNTKLATAESMTHDVIRDLLGVKLDMTKYANLINQKQLQKLIEDAAQQTQEFIAMEQEIRKLKRQINELLEERDRCISEIDRKEAEILAGKMSVVQLQGRDQLLTAQNEMLKADKTNLQKRAAELDDMIKKLLGGGQHQKSIPIPIPKASSSSSSEFGFGKRVADSERLLLRVNNELAQYQYQYRNPERNGTEKKHGL